MTTPKKTLLSLVLLTMVLISGSMKGDDKKNESNQTKDKPRVVQQHRPVERNQTQTRQPQGNQPQQQMQMQERQRQQQLQREETLKQQQLRRQQMQQQQQERQQLNLQRQQQLQQTREQQIQLRQQQQLQQQQVHRGGIQNQNLMKQPGQQMEYQRGPGLRSNANAGTQRVLSTEESQQRLRQWNQNRTQMTGVNHRPLPSGQVTALNNGRQVIQTRQGSQVFVRPNGSVDAVRLRDGRQATFHSNGQLGSLSRPGLRIDRGLRGERTIVTENNNRRLVSQGPHRGYLERPYMNRNGAVYVQRTYWDGRRPYVRVYRDNYYSGVHYYRYVPAYYYHPVFYTWAYNPWPPVRYQWGWYAEPWHVYYQGYFVPAPVYASPLLWLTDFLMIEELRRAYQARQEAEAREREQAQEQASEQEPPPSGEGEGTSSVQLSPEVKIAIQAEVQRQIEAERAEATQGPQQVPPQGPPPNTPAPETGTETQAPPPALDPTHRLFVVSNSLTVSTVTSQECELTAGDVITRIDDTPGDDNRVRVSVLAGKAGDCAVGSTPLVAVEDLQEMQNSFQATVDSGLQKLSTSQGTGGMPAAPDTRTTPGQVPPPTPDGAVDSQLQQQQAEAAQEESQIQEQITAEQDQAEQ